VKGFGHAVPAKIGELHTVTELLLIGMSLVAGLIVDAPSLLGIDGDVAAMPARSRLSSKIGDLSEACCEGIDGGLGFILLIVADRSDLAG
jgi:hypothetical protein